MPKHDKLKNNGKLYSTLRILTFAVPAQLFASGTNFASPFIASFMRSRIIIRIFLNLQYSSFFMLNHACSTCPLLNNPFIFLMNFIKKIFAKWSNKIRWHMEVLLCFPWSFLWFCDMTELRNFQITLTCEFYDTGLQGRWCFAATTSEYRGRK